MCTCIRAIYKAYVYTPENDFWPMSFIRQNRGVEIEIEKKERERGGVREEDRMMERERTQKTNTCLEKG